MNDFIIIIPTHSRYINIVKSFLQLLKKNWINCPYKIIISIIGENKKINGYECIYNGSHASLIDSIVNVANKYNSKYYISFLGDAFIYKKLDENNIIKLLNSITFNKIEYVSLNYVRKYKREKKYNSYFRYINKKDRYSHSFVSFIISNDYLNKTFKKFKSDLDFEMFYLKANNNDYYKNHIIVNKNYFNIIPCITKGKWDRLNYHKVKKLNPEIEYENLNKQTWVETIVDHLRKNFIHLFPEIIRNKIRNIVYKILKRKRIN